MNKDQFIAEFSDGNGMQQTCANFVEAGISEPFLQGMKNSIKDGIPLSDVYRGALRMTYALLTASVAKLPQEQRALFAVMLVDVGTRELEHAVDMLMKGAKL